MSSEGSPSSIFSTVLARARQLAAKFSSSGPEAASSPPQTLTISQIVKHSADDDDLKSNSPDSEYDDDDDVNVDWDDVKKLVVECMELDASIKAIDDEMDQEEEEEEMTLEAAIHHINKVREDYIDVDDDGWTKIEKQRSDLMISDHDCVQHQDQTALLLSQLGVPREDYFSNVYDYHAHNK